MTTTDKETVKNALDGQTSAEKKALAEALFHEATGRFPQDSADRKAVYKGGLWLAGSAFGLTVLLVAALALTGSSGPPEWISVLASALISGVLGGLFGYARD